MPSIVIQQAQPTHAGAAEQQQTATNSGYTAQSQVAPRQLYDCRTCQISSWHSYTNFNYPIYSRLSHCTNATWLILAHDFATVLSRGPSAYRDLSLPAPPARSSSYETYNAACVTWLFRVNVLIPDFSKRPFHLELRYGEPAYNLIRNDALFQQLTS